MLFVRNTAERFENDLLKPEDCLRNVLRTQAQFANENAGCAAFICPLFYFQNMCNNDDVSFVYVLIYCSIIPLQMV